ncbi:MAG: DUF91 domain-containing protein [Bacteroidales bacterium]|nr:DUF91 domain-containing protein [Bacteroidales bacterium]
MKKYLAEVSELEPLVIETLDQLEKGLKPLDKQISIGNAGRPDILAVDQNGTFVIIEIKSVTADNDAISQGIRYYEWFLPNIGLVSRTFPKVKPKNGIRLIYIAPGFTDETKNLVKYLDLDITLVKYIGLEDNKTKDTGIIYEILELEPAQVIDTFSSIDDIKDYITDQDTRIQLDKIIDNLESKGIAIQPHKGGQYNWIECVFENEKIAYFQTRRKYVNWQIFDNKKNDFIWPPLRITSYKQWTKECKDEIINQTKNE